MYSTTIERARPKRRATRAHSVKPTQAALAEKLRKIRATRLRQDVGLDCRNFKIVGFSYVFAPTGECVSPELFDACCAPPVDERGFALATVVIDSRGHILSVSQMDAAELINAQARGDKIVDGVWRVRSPLVIW